MNIVFTRSAGRGASARASSRASSSGRCTRSTTTSRCFAGWKVVVIVPLAADRGRPVARLPPDLASDRARDRGLLRRDLGCLPDPLAVPWVLGMVTFWTTRVRALFEVYFVAELLLSGRLVPLQLMPALGRRPSRTSCRSSGRSASRSRRSSATCRPTSLCSGSAMQVLWIGVGVSCSSVRVDARRSSDSRRWADERAPSACLCSIFAGRRDERAAVPRQLLHPALPVADPGRDRADRARARLLAHDRAERVVGVGAARGARRADPGRRADPHASSSRTWSG